LKLALDTAGSVGGILIARFILNFFDFDFQREFVFELEQMRAPCHEHSCTSL
jgi:hypothetical protein